MMKKYPEDIKERREIMYQYEIRYGNNWFMNLLASHIGLKRMYDLGIIKFSKDSNKMSRDAKVLETQYLIMLSLLLISMTLKNLLIILATNP